MDVAGVVSGIARRYDLDLPPKIVMFHYDEDADTLYHGEIILGLNQKGKIVNMTIINALTHKQK